MFGAIRDSPTPAVAYSDYWLLDENGKELPRWTRKSCTSSGMVFKELLIYGMAVQANLMVPKQLFRRVGFYDETVSWGEDTDMILRLSRQYPFQYVDEKLYGYRVHPGNTWNRMGNRQRQAMKAPIIERHFRAEIRDLDTYTRRTGSRQLVERYLEAHNYRRAMANSSSDPALFAHCLSMIGKTILFDGHP